VNVPCHEPESLRPQTREVVVVDDDVAVAALMERWLSTVGVKVHHVEDGLSALSVVATHPVDAVFADIELTKENGIDFVRLVHLVMPSLPLCLMSGRMEEHRALGALPDGMAAFLAKPLTRTAVLRQVAAMSDRVAQAV